MILDIEFVHSDNTPIIRGQVDIPDLPSSEHDLIKRLIYMKQELVLTGANRFRMNVKHKDWSLVYLPIVNRRSKTRT